jgi:phosphonate transport system substrate-binding protein
MALLVLAFTMILAGCGSASNVNPSQSNKFSLKELRFGLIPAEGATQEINNTTPLRDVLAQKFGVPVTLYVGTSYTATIEALQSGKIDIAFLGPFSYLIAHAKYGIEAILRTLSPNNSKPSSYSYIITKPNSGINTITDLKGHTFSFVDPASTSGYLVPRYMMIKAGLKPDTDIKGILVGTHVASLVSVLNHKVDAGAVSSDVYFQQQQMGTFKESDLKIVATSFPILQGPLAVRKDMSMSDRQILQEVFTSLTDKKILNKAGNGGYVIGKDGDYDGLRDVVKVLNIDLSSLGK